MTTPLKWKATVTLHSWWHAGSGEAGGGDLDATVVRDNLGLPYLPGKTLKGLLRDAALLITRAQPHLLGEGAWIALFGPAIPPGEKRPETGENRLEGLLRVSSARLPEDFRRWAAKDSSRRVLSGLFETIASTAIDETGTAMEHTLRKIEATLPCTLEAEIECANGVPGVDLHRVMETCAKLVRRLGSHRHRGLGRCSITLEKA